MNKKEFISRLSQNTGFSKNETQIFVNEFINLISETLTSGDSVKFVGFGTFGVKERSPRMGRNPKTNEEIPIPASRVPNFKPGEFLKSIVK